MDVRIVNGDTVVFWDTVAKTQAESDRYDVFVNIPELSKPYFYSSADNPERPDEMYIDTTLLSTLPKGFKTKSYPATKSLFYTPPYFIKLKNPNVTTSNYLLYKSFLKPNFEDCILAMVSYHEDINGFVAEYAPDIVIELKQLKHLNKNLEFVFIDSNKEQLAVEDDSQLFFSLTIS